jgi:CubicO group peptidase (beta-lactamase class C family)/Zn-dependent protease with chaperone function
MIEFARGWLEYVWLGLWQGTLLTGAVLLGMRALRLRAAARHCTLLLLMFALLALPFLLRARVVLETPSAAPLTVSSSQLSPPASLPATSASADVVETETVAAPSLLAPVRTVTIFSGAWITALFIVWGSAVILGLGRVARALLVIRSIRRHARPLPEKLYARCVDLLGGPPSRGLLRVSEQVRAPMTLGIARQRVVLPAGIAEHLSDDELRDVLLHELAHVQRRDGLSCAFQRLAEALLIHHPLAWWLGRRLSVEREWACDERVVLRTGAPNRYARSLLRVADLTRSAPLLLMASSAPGAGLTTRIERLLRPRAWPSLRLRALLVGAAVVLFTAAAASPRPHVRAARATPANQENVTPLDSSNPTARALGDRIDATLQNYTKHGFSGVVLVARGGEIILHKGYGFADRERAVPMNANTYFSTAGITKALTAAGVLLLEQDGVLRSDDPVARFIGELPGSKNGVNLHHLLTHTDGLSRPGAQLSTASQESFVASLKQTPIAYAPGTATRYTDVGYSLLGVVLERATGESYESFIRRRVMVPAGMLDSRFENEDLPRGATLAREYSGPVGAQHAVAPRRYTWGRRASLGLVSTALDVYRLLRASETHFPEPVRRKLFQPQTTTDYDAALHAYGWDVLERRGSQLHRRLAGTPGFEGEVLHDLANDWSAVILVNSAVGWRYAVWDEIAQAFRGLPPTNIDFVLTHLRYAPYQGGSVQPVRLITPTN